LLPGECKLYTSSYFPSTVIANGLPHDQSYSDTARVDGIRRFSGDGTSPQKFNTASANYRFAIGLDVYGAGAQPPAF
jgi:hypothetical protein